MNNSRPILYAIFSIIMISLCSCREPHPAEPVNHIPDSRSYSWSIDTVRTGTQQLLGIWGSNENDIWLWGITEDYTRTLFHYDGITAAPASFAEKVEPAAVFGFSPVDIWMTGNLTEGKDSLSFWHYNGSWSCKAKFNFPGNEIAYITDIWGDSPDNIYAVGTAVHINSERVFQSVIALLFHYDGNQWTRVIIPAITNEFSRIRGVSGSDKYYILSSASTAGNYYTIMDTVKIFEFDGKNVKTLLSSYTKRADGFGMNEIDKQLYFSMESKIYRFRNEQLVPYIQSPDQNYRIEFWGRNEKDIFLSMKNGLAHYNGSNIEYIYKFSADHITLTGLIYFKNSVFILAFDSSIMSNILIKGTAKN